MYTQEGEFAVSVWRVGICPGTPWCPFPCSTLVLPKDDLKVYHVQTLKALLLAVVHKYRS